MIHGIWFTQVKNIPRVAEAGCMNFTVWKLTKYSGVSNELKWNYFRSTGDRHFRELIWNKYGAEVRAIMIYSC